MSAPAPLYRGRVCSICGELVDVDAVCAWWVPVATPAGEPEREVQMRACYPACCATFLPPDVLRRLEIEAALQAEAERDDGARFVDHLLRDIERAGQVGERLRLIERRLDEVPR